MPNNDSTSEQLLNFSYQNIPDLLTSRTHGRDFLSSRAQYIHSRFYLLALFFAISVVAWIPIDYITLSDETFQKLVFARIVLAASYLGLFVWRYGETVKWLVRIRLFMFVLLPTLFSIYAVGAVEGEPTAIASRIYHFYPFIIVLQLAIFPLTLLEGTILALPGFITLLIIQTQPDLLWGDIWLWGLILVIILWAQLSQLQMLLRLYRQATFDPLTCLFNRRVLMDRMEVEMAAAQRYDRSLSIMLFDLDKFKRVNDIYGHLGGDEVLRRFAGLLQDALRNVDIVGRYGGEEFLVVLPETTIDVTAEIAERIRLGCHDEVVELNGHKMSFTTSIGIAQMSDMEDMEAFINRADEALYSAKEQGRDRFVLG